MSLDSVLDKAFGLLEKSIEDRKIANAAENDRLTKIEAEREKTKQMGFSSQERIQHLINQGLIDRQELVNQGIMNKEELANSGLMERQVTENKTRLDERQMINAGELAVQGKRDAGSFERSKLAAGSAENIAGINAKSKMQNNWMTVPEFDSMGTKISERIVNPNINTRVGDYETGNPEEIDSLFKRGSAPIPPMGAGLKKTEPLKPLTDLSISPGRHTTERQTPVDRSPLGFTRPSASPIVQERKNKLYDPYRRMI